MGRGWVAHDISDGYEKKKASRARVPGSCPPMQLYKQSFGRNRLMQWTQHVRDHIRIHHLLGQLPLAVIRFDEGGRGRFAPNLIDHEVHAYRCLWKSAGLYLKRIR